MSQCRIGRSENGVCMRFAVDRESRLLSVLWLIAGGSNITGKKAHILRQAAYKKLGLHNVAELAPLTVLIERGKI